LPAERELARRLGVSRTTVVSAYDLLRQEGLLLSRQGSGTRIRPRTPGDSPALREPAPSLRQHPVYRSLVEGASGTIEFLGAHLPGAGEIGERLLALGGEPLSSLAREPGYVPLGVPELRRAIARHLDGWGLPTREEQVLVTSGAQQAIGLAGALFLQRADAVVLENPTYLGAIDIFASLGARAISLPVGAEGISSEDLREAVERHDPRLVYLMPTFHNPTGCLLPERERRSIARLAEERQIPIVEDNTLADLSLGADPPPPIAAFSRAAPVLTVGSLSKLFWGGLRIGWVRASEEIVTRLARLKIMADLGSSVLSQAAAVRLLEDADGVRKLRRREIAARFQELTAQLSRLLPDWTWFPPAGGLSLWVRLPRGSAEEFVAVALRHGVSVVPGSLASPDGGGSDHLRLPFVLEPRAMTEGVERLARAWKAYVPGPGTPVRSLDVLV
jgi:DNA-binding transcriptional MocR family regulator